MSAAPHRQTSRLRAAIVGLAACEAIATAVWLLPATVNIVQWPASGSIRLALLAPAWQLAAWWGVGLLVAGALVGRSPARAGRLAPLLLLWLWAVPYLPYLSDRFPLLLVLAGPVRWLIAGVAVAWTVRETLGALMQVAPSLIGRRGVFIVSLLLYVGAGLYSARAVGVGGDEPHYLIITESLLRDGDLQIENNHRQRDYQSFFAGELRPDFFERGKNGQIYSIHAPGLPALILPAYALAGRLGTVAFIALLAALTALAMFDLAELIGGRGVALLTWLGTCLAVPFLPYAWMIFPEMPGALLVAWGALWLQRAEERPLATWALRGVALAALPWLHTKFIVFLAMLSLGFGLKLLRRPARLSALATPIALSVAAWFYSFYAIYGSVNPEAPYGAYSRIYVLTEYIPHGLIGIFFDQKFGLLFYSPIYLTAIGGAWWLLRRSDTRLLGMTVVLAVLAFVGSTARLYMFWGGSSAPARFLVPVLPCLAPMIAAALPHLRSALTRGVVGTWLLVGALVAWVGVASPSDFMLFSDPHGRARILEWLQAGSPLASAVPTFTEPTWSADVPALVVWLVVALASLTLTALVARSGRLGAWGVAVLASVVFLGGGSVMHAQPPDGVRTSTARRGALITTTMFDGDRVRTLRYDLLRRATPEELAALTTFDLERAGPSPGTTAITMPVVVPPGAYDAVVSLATASPVNGEITVSDSPRAIFGRATGVFATEVRVPFVVPMTTRRLTVNVADAALAKSVARVHVVPRRIVPPALREPRPVRATELLAGSQTRAIGYTDEHAYPEGGVFWTRGTARTEVVVATDGATRMTLTLSTGPNRGTVTLTVGEQTRAVDMAGGEEQTLSFPVNATERLVVVGVQSTSMFRPSEEDPRSTDNRGLGCQVRITLE